MILVKKRSPYPNFLLPILKFNILKWKGMERKWEIQVKWNKDKGGP